MEVDVTTKEGKKKEKKNHREVRGERDLEDMSKGMRSQRRQERVQSRAQVEGWASGRRACLSPKRRERRRLSGHPGNILDGEESR